MDQHKIGNTRRGGQPKFGDLLRQPRQPPRIVLSRGLGMRNIGLSSKQTTGRFGLGCSAQRSSTSSIRATYSDSALTLVGAIFIQAKQPLQASVTQFHPCSG